jgi:uncharacterized lipoprotein NlpE involved in copper resistance
MMLTAALLVFWLGACQRTSDSQTQASGPAAGQAQTAESEAIDAAHNSRNSLNWDGVYTGTIPAADGEGIDVRLTLNLDETYEIRYEYIGKSSGFTEKGNFTWDEDGAVVTLDSRDLPPHYRVGENMLTQLDMEGNEITGDLADNYLLHKKP